MPTIILRILQRLPRLARFSTTAGRTTKYERAHERTTGIYNDPASSRAADEYRPITGTGKDALTEEVGSRQFEKQETVGKVVGLSAGVE